MDQLEGSDKDVKALVETLIKEGKEVPKIYLACGTEDFLYDANVDYKNFLEEHHVDVTMKKDLALIHGIFGILIFIKY